MCLLSRYEKRNHIQCCRVPDILRKGSLEEGITRTDGFTGRWMDGRRKEWKRKLQNVIVDASRRYSIKRLECRSEKPFSQKQDTKWRLICPGHLMMQDAHLSNIISTIHNPEYTNTYTRTYAPTHLHYYVEQYMCNHPCVGSYVYTLIH